MRTNLTAGIYRRLDNNKLCFVEKLWLFGLFSGDKGDCIDVWMIKTTIETNQIDMDACFFQKQITYKDMFVLKVRLFYQFIGF